MRETMGNKARLKRLRQVFNEAVLARAGGLCMGPDCKDSFTSRAVDAHHITDRHEMPNGGYAKENGIGLCADCHLKAEKYHQTKGQEHVPGYHPDELYTRIGSSKQNAEEACKKLS